MQLQSTEKSWRLICSQVYAVHFTCHKKNGDMKNQKSLPWLAMTFLQARLNLKAVATSNKASQGCKSRQRKKCCQVTPNFRKCSSHTLTPKTFGLPWAGGATGSFFPYATIAMSWTSGICLHVWSCHSIEPDAAPISCFGGLLLLLTALWFLFTPLCLILPSR